MARDVFGPVQHPAAAKAGVSPEGQFYFRPGLAQPRGEQLEDGPGVAGGIDDARAQIGHQQLLTAEDVERQEAPVAIVAVKVAAFLLAMHAVIGGVEIQDQLGGRRGKGSDELLHQHLVESDRRRAVHALLEPAKRGVAGQRLRALS